MDLQQGVEQTVQVGVLLAKPTKFEDPMNPVYGALLSWYYWRYIVKSDGTVVDIVTRTWSDIPNCAGCYFLTLTATDTNKLGPLTVYIYDAASLGKPIFIQFEVTAKPHAQKG
jgi:hypothetical protein